MNKLFWICILLFSFCCFTANSENSNTQIVSKAKFNLNNLYSQNKYSIMNYGIYNPEDAIAVCAKIPAGGIWPSPAPGQPDTPSPIPTNCGEPNSNQGGVQAQIAYGCHDLTIPDSIGERLTRSVLKVRIPHHGTCSATLIAQDWGITAAHCVINNGTGEFPATLKEYPAEITNSINNDTTIVDDIYIPADYRYYITNKPIEEQPYPGYRNGDFALLHLKNPLPDDKFYPIKLSSTAFPDHPASPIPIWSAGYGYDENNNHGKLQFRQQYFITNINESNWFKGQTGNFGEIYTVGSIPDKYNNVDSAWSFTSAGDSGGPVILQDRHNNLFLEGVYSGSLFCNYPGYFAKMPYPLSNSVSIPYYHNLITSIMDGTVNELLVRHLNDHKSQEMLFAVDGLNKIHGYKILEDGALEHSTEASTGTYPSQIAAAKYKDNLTNLYDRYVFVSNYYEPVISSYKIDDSGNLKKLADTRISYPYTKTPNLIGIKTFNKSVYIIDKNKVISSYLISTEESLKPMHSITSVEEPFSAEVVYRQRLTSGMNYSYTALFVTNYNDKSISIFNITNFWNLELVKKVRLEPNMGHPIEISAVPMEPEYFYLLTTTGVFLQRFNYDLTLQPISNRIREFNYFHEFDIYSHIKAVSTARFAVTTHNKTEEFEILFDVTYPEAVYDMPNSAANGLSIEYNNKYSLYVSNFYKNTISKLNIPDKRAPIVTQTKVTPTAIKYVK